MLASYRLIKSVINEFCVFCLQHITDKSFKIVKTAPPSSKVLENSRFGLPFAKKSRGTTDIEESNILRSLTPPYNLTPFRRFCNDHEYIFGQPGPGRKKYRDRRHQLYSLQLKRFEYFKEYCQSFGVACPNIYEDCCLDSTGKVKPDDEQDSYEEGDEWDEREFDTNKLKVKFQTEEEMKSPLLAITNGEASDGKLMILNF